MSSYFWNSLHLKYVSIELVSFSGSSDKDVSTRVAVYAKSQKLQMNKKSLIEIDRIIEMAWEDRTPFEAIFDQFDINEKELISLMRNNLRNSSFKLWRKRVSGRKTKHSKLRENSVDRFKCKMQRNISNNKISKR